MQLSHLNPIIPTLSDSPDYIFFFNLPLRLICSSHSSSAKDHWRQSAWLPVSLLHKQRGRCSRETQILVKDEKSSLALFLVSWWHGCRRTQPQTLTSVWLKGAAVNECGGFYCCPTLRWWRLRKKASFLHYQATPRIWVNAAAAWLKERFAKSRSWWEERKCPDKSRVHITHPTSLQQERLSRTGLMWPWIHHVDVDCTLRCLVWLREYQINPLVEHHWILTELFFDCHWG